MKKLDDVEIGAFSLCPSAERKLDLLIEKQSDFDEITKKNSNVLMLLSEVPGLTFTPF